MAWIVLLLKRWTREGENVGILINSLENHGFRQIICLENVVLHDYQQLDDSILHSYQQ